MHTRTTRALLGAAALALLAGACTDSPTTTAPAARAADRPARTTSSGTQLVPATVRYRDTGGKPATGRAGSAVVDALALLDKEGATTLEFSARHATNWWGYGEINKAQIKASAPDGKHKFTRNLVESDPWYGPRGPVPGQVQLHGLGRGDKVQLQANVTGLDPHRTDVVTVDETVKRLPDLTVDLVAPAEAETNTWVNVLATVAERNGDMGADAWCELRVSGQTVDYGWAYVDAGDAVACALTWSFSSPGSYPLEVRVSTWGREWDTANNTDTATIQVHGESPTFYTTASFHQTTMVDSSTWVDTWRNTATGDGSEYRSERATSSTYQSAYMWGYMPAQLTGPVGLKVSMSTGGNAVHAAEWTEAPAADPYGWCTSRWEGRAAFWMCAYGGAWPTTYFSYSWVAGTVTYHSLTYLKVWDGITGSEQYYYHWNDRYSYDDGLAALGGDWSFEVRMDAPDRRHVLQESLQLQQGGGWEWSAPYACSTWEEPEWEWSSTTCSSWFYRSEDIFGYSY